MAAFRKAIFKVLFLCYLPGSVYSQTFEGYLSHRKDSLRKVNLKMAVPDFFFNRGSDGLCYLGITNSFEVNSYYLGGEFKLYDSYYTPVWGGSLYANFRAPIARFSETPNLNAVSIGGHFTILGLEMTTYFNKTRSYYCLSPKLGFDYGSWSAFYGFNFPIGQYGFQGINRHSISIKYFLYLSTIKYYRMRKKSYGY